MTKSVEVANALQRLSTVNEVQVLYACESGSRAWGFESPDSDYDVRFIYVHNRDWYLSLNVEDKRDVIKQTVGDLDLEGWDVRKALRLFYKSNPSLMEWLRSPMVYQSPTPEVAQLMTMAEGFFNLRSSAYHYYHMANNNYKKYLCKEGDVWTKKYFYVLRPLLCVRWLKAYGSAPPVLFGELLPLLPDELRPAVDDLLSRKMAGEELRHGLRVPLLHDFLVEELATTGDMSHLPSPVVSDTALNVLYRQMLGVEYWE